MAATVVGTDVVTSLSRRFILPTIIDQIYGTNALFWRLNSAGKKRYIQGGTHVEVPFMYAEFSNGGPFQGYDLLDTAPNDTVKNGVFEMKQHHVPVSIDDRTLVRFNSPDSAFSGLSFLWEQARMQLASNIGTGLYSDAVTNPKQISGLQGAVDAGGVATTYAGLTRASNTYLNSQVDSTTATLTLSALNTWQSSFEKGGYTNTLILSRKEQYNRLWALLIANQRYEARDETLTNAGFTNLLFNNVPWVKDDKVFDGPNASNSAIVGLCEDVIELAIFGNTDFAMEDFRKPTNQMAMVGFLLCYLELMVLAPRVQGKMTNVSA